MGLLKTKKEKNRLKHLRERVSSGHKWADQHVRVGSWTFNQLRKKIISTKTYASVLLATINGPRSTLAWVLGLLKDHSRKSQAPKAALA